MFDVITIGSAVRDLFVKSKTFKARRDEASPTGLSLPLPLGSKLNLDEIIFETGGGATNAAVTFSRQNIKVACISPVGSDPGGRAVLESLEDEGVNTSLIYKSKEGQTGYSIILTTTNGERTILTYRGLSSEFSMGMIPKTKLEADWIFITSLSGNLEIVKNIVDWADKKDVKTAFIPGGKELEQGKKILAPIFAKTDVVIMNREEAAELTGAPFEDKEKVVHKACLLTKGIGVITDGPYGATACDRDFFYHIGTHGNKAVDRTGAGDAFASGFVAGLIKYGNVEGALELAADNSSSVVNFYGAKKGIVRSGQKVFRERLKVTKVKTKKKETVFT